MRRQPVERTDSDMGLPAIAVSVAVGVPRFEVESRRKGHVCIEGAKGMFDERQLRVGYRLDAAGVPAALAGESASAVHVLGRIVRTDPWGSKFWLSPSCVR